MASTLNSSDMGSLKVSVRGLPRVDTANRYSRSSENLTPTLSIGQFVDQTEFNMLALVDADREIDAQLHRVRSRVPDRSDGVIPREFRLSRSVSASLAGLASCRWDRVGGSVTSSTGACQHSGRNLTTVCCRSTRCGDLGLTKLRSPPVDVYQGEYKERSGEPGRRRAPGRTRMDRGAPHRRRPGEGVLGHVHDPVGVGGRRNGPVLEFEVPDRRQAGLDSVRVVEIAGADHRLLDTGGYRAAIAVAPRRARCGSCMPKGWSRAHPSSDSAVASRALAVA